MSFTDRVKQEACKKAHFMCVACHTPFVEVHHITPQSEGGPNTPDNAAPLCAGCHGIYGGNPDFRKQIRQMRDNWYDVCERKYGQADIQVSQKLNELGDTLRTFSANQLKYQTTLNELKSTIVGSLGATADAVNYAGTFEEIVTASGYSPSAIPLGPNVYSNFQCRKCGTVIGLLVGSDKCPTCGTPIKP